jgi:hypothetical protein
MVAWRTFLDLSCAFVLATVAREISGNANSLVTGLFVGPRASAEASTTTAPKHTLRPRKRTDVGVRRRRQPSAAQQ